jgi:hypothetical protein
MKSIYIGFDDTDTLDADRGTGKLVRWFEGKLPSPCRMWGVVRQQLLVDPRIPYTSHNSAACAVVHAPDGDLTAELISRAVRHIETHFIEGSDPGLCVVSEDSPALGRLAAFGRRCASDLVTQGEAIEAASGAHLSGHGGSNDGIIGAAAAVGLTAHGWGGRFIEFGRLRDFSGEVAVSDLEGAGIHVVSTDRDVQVPGPADRIDTRGWLRPALWGGRPVLAVAPAGKGLWQTIGRRKRTQTEKEG